MRIASPLRALFFVGSLLTTLLAAAAAQQPDAKVSRLTTSETVSLADLRVPPSARQHLEKARAAALTHRDDVYQHELQKALAIAPEFSGAYLLMASRDNNAGRYEEAIANASKAQQIDPSAAWAAVIIASAYNGEQRYDDAIAVLSNLRGAGADGWQPKYEMARAEIGLRNVDGSLRWSELALKAAPESCTDARLLVANALQLAHRWKEAADQLQLYLAIRAAPLFHKASAEAALERTRLLAEIQEREASQAH